jgi:hypothetical protein
MTLETLTLQEIVRFANSGDIDTAQFGQRAIRLITLAAYREPTDEQLRETINLDKVLRKDLVNPAFVAHIRKGI